MTHKLSKSKSIDYYWLGIDRDNHIYNGTTGNESRETFGLRHWGDFSESWSYEGELAYQGGSVGAEDILTLRNNTSHQSKTICPWTTLTAFDIEWLNLQADALPRTDSLRPFL